LLQVYGDTDQIRLSELTNLKEKFRFIKGELDGFRSRFPEKFYLCNYDESKKKTSSTRSNSQAEFVSTEIISCFPVLREKGIKTWDIDEMAGDSFEDSGYLGSLQNPFNLFKYKIPLKEFLTVCKLLSPMHY
jgi:hypothetical protein